MQNELNFEVIAKNLFGDDARKFKAMTEKMSKSEMEDLMQKFQQIPLQKREQFMQEVQESIKKVSGSSVVGVAKVRY
ncbi:MAG: hypothetical protein ACRCXZ_08035 [Patescibacteria group bacterium]